MCDPLEFEEIMINYDLLEGVINKYGLFDDDMGEKYITCNFIYLTLDFKFLIKYSTN